MVLGYLFEKVRSVGSMYFKIIFKERQHILNTHQSALYVR